MARQQDCKLVAYYRVSTRQQGESGLGLEGQQAAVAAYARTSGCDVVREYQEVESGRKCNRAELHKAMAHARRIGATLVIAKLDRLARNVHFLSGLMEGGVDFVACDLPQANRLTLHIMAAVAEAEAKMISERTREALAAYKARGGLLGAALPQCRNLTAEAAERGRVNGRKAVSERARQAYADLMPLMIDLRSKGWPQQAIADELNRLGHTTRSGGRWGQVQVLRALRRAD